MARALTPADMAPTEFNPQEDEYRSVILRMLNSLRYPQGWRVVMSMDNFTEKVRLEVQVAVTPYAFNLFGVRVFDRVVNWETRREIAAATYQALYILLKTQPEFLEFQTIIGGEFALVAASGGSR